MKNLIVALLAVQVVSFVVIGVWYLTEGNWRLGVSQVLLAAVQGIIYSGGLE